MLIPLHVLLASAVVHAGGDSVKKKTAVPSPAKAASTVARAGKPMLLGAAIERTLTSTAHAATPRATYLRAAVASRVAGGPPVPAKFRTSAAVTPIVADSIVVEKSIRTLTLYHRGTPVRVYLVALGKQPVGPKTAQGDGKTPEGLYHIEAHNPDSKYHLSLKVSYPNAADVAAARAHGVSTGGEIMIHGLPPAFADYGEQHRRWNWTLGCIAVTNDEIEEIWSAVGDGAAILIKP